MKNYATTEEAEKAVEEIVKKFVEFVKKCEEYDTK